MELSNKFIIALFVVLGLVFFLVREDAPGEQFAHGVWRGEIITVTAKGAMIKCADGQFWVSDNGLSESSIKGDSLIVFGSANGMFIKPFSVRVKESSGFFSDIRRSYKNLLYSRISDPASAGLTGGILMGLRGMIPAEVASVFKTSGTSHLLALSGLHTGIVALTVAFLLRALFGKKTITTWLTILCIILFVGLSGGRASTIRAGIMACSILLWFQYRGGKIHMLSVWWMALLISLILSPGTLFDKGAQMSYGAVLSLIVFGKQFHGKAGKILSLLFAGVTITIALAPLMIHIYKGFVLQGPVATVASMPFMYSVMILGSLASAGMPFMVFPLEVIAVTWIDTLKLFDYPLLTITPAILYPFWVLLLVLLRVFGKWNMFHKRLR